jgi:CHASE2 domain-containing sensor protein
VLFAAGAAALIAPSATLLTLAFRAPRDARALVTSAVLAWIIQVVAFAIARRSLMQPKRPIMIAWLLGMVLRFAAVVAYAVLAVYAWQLPAVPALVSFVIFLFVSTLLEPFLLHT